MQVLHSYDSGLNDDLCLSTSECSQAYLTILNVSECAILICLLIYMNTQHPCMQTHKPAYKTYGVCMCLIYICITYYIHAQIKSLSKKKPHTHTLYFPNLLFGIPVLQCQLPEGGIPALQV